MPDRPKGTLKQLLPTEHGSWAFVAEPLLIAVILGSNWPLCAATFLLFLAYRPARLAVGDLRKGKRYPRTKPGLYTSLGTVLLAMAILTCTHSQLLEWPLLIAAVMGVLFLWVDLKAKPRALSRELFGAVLTIPVAIAAMQGAVPQEALVWIAALLTLRALTAVLAVRGLLARWPDAAACRWSSCALATIMLIPAVIAPVTLTVIAAYSLVVARTFWFALTPKPRIPRIVGVQEAVIAFICVASWFKW